MNSMKFASYWKSLLAGMLLALIAACGSEPDQLEEAAMPLVGEWTGDLDGMVERRQVRALVPYGRAFYFVDSEGRQRGLSHDFMEAFEAHLNRTLDSGLMRVRVVYVPVTRDRLLGWLAEGRGDVVAADLTITESRAEQVAFTEPLARNVRELLVSGPNAEPVHRLEDLSGRTVFVREQSSYYESLRALSRELANRRLGPVRLEIAPGHFEVGDVLEMVNAGVVDYAVADDYLADFWETVLPEITVHRDLALREGADIAFAVRPDSPQLRKELNAFLETHRAGTLFGNITFQRYLEDNPWVRNPADSEAMERFRRTAEIFRRYAGRYDLDWLMLIAQAYQESGLDHSARSSAGAVGIMQILPSTGAEMDVGDIRELENNIHAAARYIRFMIDRYYAEDSMDEENRILFALASYNAGPRRVRQLRQQAAAEGLDPDRWFDHVEHVAARQIGRETVSYVSNIYKYYIAYKLVVQRRDPEALFDLTEVSG